MVDGDGDKEWKICLGDFDGKVAGVWVLDMAHMPCLLSGLSSLCSAGQGVRCHLTWGHLSLPARNVLSFVPMIIK